MVTFIPARNEWAKAFQNFGEGLSEGYMGRADELALQNAIKGLEPNATPRQILDAITGTKTYSPAAKQNALKNYMGVAEFEHEQKKFQEKQAEDIRHQKEMERLKQLEIDKATEQARAKAAESENKKLAAENKAKAKKEADEAKLVADRDQARVILEASGKFTPDQVEKMVEGGLKTTGALGLIKPEGEAQFEKESDKLAAQRVSKYITETEDSAKVAQGDLMALDLQDDLARQGATGFKLQNAVADFLESKGFKNVEALRDPLSKAYNSVSKTLMRGFGDIVKGKVSNLEFGTLRGMLAQAEDTPEAAAAMVEVQRLIRKINIEENRIMQGFIAEDREKERSPGPEIQHKVDQALRPIADQYTRESSEKIKNILNPRTNVKNEELNEKLWNEAWGT